MKYYFTFLILLATILSSCKKDNSDAQGTVEFDLDGVHHSFHPRSSVLRVDTLHDGIMKSIDIGWNDNFLPYFSLNIAEETNNTESDYLPVGTYSGIYNEPGCSDSLSGDCHIFYMMWADDIAPLASNVYLDSISSLHLTSCSGAPPRINATFECELKDLYGTDSIIKHVRNGKLINVQYVRQ